jgi:hypothetical protein
MRARWHVAREASSTLLVPWCAVGEAARQLDQEGRQQLLAALAAPMVVIAPREAASAVTCAAMTDYGRDLPGWDAAQVVHEASRRGWPVVTSEAYLDRLLAIDPDVTFERLP